MQGSAICIDADRTVPDLGMRHYAGAISDAHNAGEQGTALPDPDIKRTVRRFGPDKGGVAAILAG